MTETSDFGTFGRYREQAVAHMPPPMREAYKFTKGLRGLVPGPHKIWLANPDLSKTIVPTGEYFQKRSTLTKAEIEIVTILTVAHWRCAYASYEHEKIGEAQGGLAAENVERLFAGFSVEFDEPRHDVVHRLASALIDAKIVPLGLFKRATTLIGEAGVVDVAALIGWLTMVSATLNAFDVPSDATGLDQ